MRRNKAGVIEEVAESSRVGPLVSRYRYVVNEHGLYVPGTGLFGTGHTIPFREIAYYTREPQGKRVKLELAVHTSNDIPLATMADFGPKRRERGLTIFELPMSPEQAERLAHALNEKGVAANAPKPDSPGQRRQAHFRRDVQAWARAAAGTYAIPKTAPGGIVIGLLFAFIAWVAAAAGWASVDLAAMLGFGIVMSAAWLAFSFFEPSRVVIDEHQVTVEYPRGRTNVIRVTDVTDIEVPGNYRLDVRVRTLNGGVSFRLTSAFAQAVSRVPLEIRTRLGMLSALD